MTDIICPSCEEPIAMGDELARYPIGWDVGRKMEVRVQHIECSMRAIIGGLNHLKGHCTCCGGIDPPDPPWLSRREAAKEAFEYYQTMRRNDPRRS